MRKILTIGGALTLAAGVAGWLYLAPTSLGGHTTYVVTHGVSMEPRFHTGDLAVLRPQASYRVGEIAAYHSATLHTVVMHRIVDVLPGSSGGAKRFVFKGDNNTWLDPDTPTKADMVGGLDLHVPGGGRFLGFLQSTRGRLVAGAALALLLLGGASGVKRRRALRTSGGRHRAGRHRAPRALASTPPRPTAPVAPAAPVAPVAPEFVPAPASDPLLDTTTDVVPSSRRGSGRRPVRSAAARGQTLGAACLVLACVAGEAWLLRLPATTTSQRSVAVQQHGTFGYTAHVPSSLVYPSGAVSAGDPIYTAIVRSLDFSFDYTAAAPLSGDVSVSAAIVEPSGWRASLATGAVEPISGGHGSASVRVDLDAAQAAIDQFEAATGLRNSVASLVITPATRAHGAVDGTPVSGDLPATLRLTFANGQLAVVPASGSSGGDSAESGPLAVSGSLDATAPSIGPREIGALGHHLTVASAREAGAGACVVAFGLLIFLLLMSRREGKAEDDVAIARRRYGERIVDAEAIPLDGPVVELTSLAALHSVAERYDRVILHTTRGQRHSYVVRDELSWYRYEIRPDRGQHAATKRGHRDARSIGVEGAVVALTPRPRPLDIVPAGVGAAAWGDLAHIA